MIAIHWVLQGKLENKDLSPPPWRIQMASICFPCFDFVDSAHFASLVVAGKSGAHVVQWLTCLELKSQQTPWKRGRPENFAELAIPLVSKHLRHSFHDQRNQDELLNLPSHEVLELRTSQNLMLENAQTPEVSCPVFSKKAFFSLNDPSYKFLQMALRDSGLGNHCRCGICQFVLTACIWNNDKIRWNLANSKLHAVASPLGCRKVFRSPQEGKSVVVHHAPRRAKPKTHRVMICALVELCN